jgi:hypothetical protein
MAMTSPSVRIRLIFQRLIYAEQVFIYDTFFASTDTYIGIEAMCSLTSNNGCMEEQSLLYQY